MSHNTVEAGAPIDWIANGWDLFKKNPGLLIGMVLVIGIILIILNFIPYLGPVLGGLLQVMLWGGMLYTLARLDSGEQAEFGDLFRAFSDSRLMTPMLILGGVSAAIALIGLAVPIAGLLGLIYWFVLVTAVPRVMATGMDGVEAIKQSGNAALSNIVPLILFLILSIVMAVAGVLALIVGILIVAPILGGAQHTAYKTIFGTPMAETPVIEPEQSGA